MATTKQQERNALAEIRKIIESLGENSYIGTAFAGCFELAEENIEMDFACSLQGRADAAEHEAADLNQKIEAQNRQIKETQMSLETARNLNKNYEAQMESMRTETQDLSTRLQDMERQASDYQRRAENAENLVIRLKSQLYDFMVTAQ